MTQKLVLIVLSLISLQSCFFQESQITLSGLGSSAGALTSQYYIENKNDGSGVALSSLTLDVSQSLNIYSVERAVDGDFMGNIETTWSIQGGAGSLTISPDGKSAVFEATQNGTSLVKIQSDGVASEVSITVSTDPSRFSVTGITGGTDNTQDASLKDGLIPTVHWEDSDNEQGYSITIYEDDEQSIRCSSEMVSMNSTSHIFSDCSLTKGQVYAVSVIAIAQSPGSSVVASNDKFRFINSPDVFVSDTSVNEGDATASVSVSLAQAAELPVILDWSTSDDSAISSPDTYKDFESASGTLTIPAGQTSANIEIPIIDDSYYEGDQDFVVTISNSDEANITQASAQVTILDNDPLPTLSILPTVGFEGEELFFEIIRNGVSEHEISFDFTTIDGSAMVANGDYTAINSTINIPAYEPNNSEVTVGVTTIDDSILCEDDIEMSAQLSNFSNAQAGSVLAAGTIKDDDFPTISFTSPSVVEGNTLDFDVSLDFNCPGGTVEFDWAAVGNTATQGLDFNSASGSITIPDPGLTDSLSVTTIDDSAVELDSENIFIATSNVKGALEKSSSTGIGTITDNESGVGVAKISAGTRHTCAVSNYGDLKCWGANAKANLGRDGFHAGDQPGEMGDNLPFVDLGTGLTAQKIVRGKTHACALLTDGRVKCWGSNEYGELGLGDTNDRGDEISEMGDNLPFVDLGTDLRASDIAVAGGPISCVIIDDIGDDSDDGKVKCWGGDWRAIGYGSATSIGNAPNEMGDNLDFISLGTNLTADKIFGGKYQMCAILNDNGTKCWGGGIGDDLADMGDNLDYLDFGTGLYATSLSIGFSLNCAVLNDGFAKCWASFSWSNAAGELGQGDTDDYQLGDATPPIDLGTGRTALQVAAGYSNACALLDNNTVKCWGRNVHGSLGVGGGNLGDEAGEMGDDLVALDFGGLTVKEISSAGYNTCAILSDDSVKCWGSGQRGGNGQGSSSNVYNPASIPGIQLGTDLRAKSLAYGAWNDGGSGLGYYNCVIVDDIADNSDDDKIKCWGGNYSGKLGHTTKNFGDEASEMGLNLPLIDFGDTDRDGTGLSVKAQDIITSNDVACALTDLGIACWGQSGPSGARYIFPSTRTTGELPNQMGNNLQFVDFGSGKTPISFALSSGWQKAGCAILNDFTTKCWGDSSNGANADPTDSRIEALSGDAMPTLDFGTGLYAVKIVGKDFGMCALLNNQDVKCWGNGIGDEPNEMGDNLLPIDLGAGAKAIDISAGARHICAALSSGDVKCWGDAANGKLGTGNETDVASTDPSKPTVDLGLPAKKVFAGNQADSNCAILSDDSLKCWGKNSSGQLGLGDTQNRGDDADEMAGFLPTLDLGTGETAVDVSVGLSHTCAVLASGAAKCWGSNRFGELGQESTTPRGDGSAGAEMGDSLPVIDDGFL